VEAAGAGLARRPVEARHEQARPIADRDELASSQ
jgi:hypothetical protein